ncbi:hypothetical protein SB4_14965 [Sphingomonas sanguinis]|uniref:Uncharacterized protein n=1 Tax=Sphingomonas sanguinis TaxID=33051 RepID=A0A147IN32_9SPHN|nr:hypothetical protein SB4_14965 [Sphingomonas sanguinis]
MQVLPIAVTTPLMPLDILTVMGCSLMAAVHRLALSVLARKDMCEKRDMMATCKPNPFSGWSDQSGARASRTM